MPEPPKILLPQLELATKTNHSPHIVILGAGASRACCPQGDKNGLPLPVMADFVSLVGLENLIENAGFDPTANFEKTYSAIHALGRSDILAEIDTKVRDFFSRYQLPDEPTVYDYLVLSLREKDLIVTFNWDPLLPQAYKRWRHLGVMLPPLAFLHGNIDLGINFEDKICGFMADDTFGERNLSPTPLLYPVEKKDYASDPFTKEQWDVSSDFLSRSCNITIFGYSAPKTEVEARDLLLRAWTNNRTRDLAEFEIIDVRPRDEVWSSWSDFIVRDHGSVSKQFDNTYLWQHPRRSCEAFAFATLQQQPWSDDPFPHAKSLSELEEWVRPLVRDELSGKLREKVERAL